MNDKKLETQYLKIGSGHIAYEVTGTGPLVVLSPGMADIRSTYRFLAPLIADAGYRVVSVDLRGHGQSSIDWDAYTHADTARDLLAIINDLGGPALLVGQSFSGGAVTLAATMQPHLVSAIIEIDPFTRPPKTSLSAFVSNKNNYRKGAISLGQFILTGNIRAWLKYLDTAYPGKKPVDWVSYLEAIQVNLSDPGRVTAVKKMVNSKVTIKEAAIKLKDVSCPALVIMGSQDSDFPHPEAEAAAIVSLLPAHLGSYIMIDRAGHYPHAQYPDKVADAILSFLSKIHHA